MMTPSPSKTAATDALVGIWMVLLTAFVIGLLYFAREVLIPIALAALLTFLLSPLAARLERWIGRVAAVLTVVALIFAMIGAGGWVLTRQLVDLATRLPDYQENIQTKLRSIRVPTGGVFSRLSKTVEEIKKDLPVMSPQPAEPVPASDTPRVQQRQPERVTVVEKARGGPMELMQTIVAPVLGPLGTAALVLLLLVFMLLKREDLRGRLIRLVGEGRISATTRAMDDAGTRVSRYLLMQLVVNVTYGIPVAVGLYFIGVPNAVLWGVFATVLRFIPYVGPWIAAAIPVALSFAVSTSWATPVLTLGLFIVLEILSNNVMEPWLYGSSTGVSPIALIIAAVFWTWLWGPVGLVLATPLTVCLAVMGRHVPRLGFLTVLLSEDEALAPHEEFYYRLIATNPDEANAFAEAFLKTHSLAELYDTVVIPVLTNADADLRRDALDEEVRVALHQDLRDILEDLGQRPISEPMNEPAVQERAENSPVLPAPWPCSVLCLPARADRDELAGAMLVQLLRKRGFSAENAAAKLVTGELLELVEKSDVDAVCVSVVAPSTVIHARYLCLKLRARFPRLKIVVGLWSAAETLEESAPRLREAGADGVVGALADAVAHLEKFSAGLAGPMMPAPIPADEEVRLAELLLLNLLDTDPEDAFDRVTRKLVRLFDVPIALITFLDRDRQFFKAQTGLPEDLAEARSTPRTSSVCGHVVASNEVLVVEDLARDRRFADNALLRQRKLRFYAGVPLRSPSGHAVGSLCILDVKPRHLSEHEKRLLQIVAEEVTEQIALRVATPAPAAI